MILEGDGLPWRQGIQPLMLAPMQGLTNRALRQLFIEKVRPDVVFTEFVRVRPGSKKSLGDSDRQEVAAQSVDVPLVVQLIGRNTLALAAAARTVGELGARHLNINLGCPYGRMTGNSAGGALLKDPAGLPEMLRALRQASHGSFSVKLRSGYDDPDQVFSLVPIFEDCGVDFLILHPRTVVQRYAGRADHAVTARLVEATSLPVIANGDIFTAAYGRQVLALTGAAGLMLGRGAVSDPYLFSRLRGMCPETPSEEDRQAQLCEYLQALLVRYQGIFFGERQILSKMKEVLCHVHDEALAEYIRDLKREKGLAGFCARLHGMGGG